MNPLDAELETLAIRGSSLRTEEQAHSEPIFATSSFAFTNAQEAADRFGERIKGNIYSRFTNPTVNCFEQRLAALEGGERAIATSSGMSAIFSLLLATLNPGDHIVVAREIFGTTYNLFNNFLPKLNVAITFVSLPHLSQWEQAINANTKLLFLETPSNPLCELVDLKQLVKLAKKNHCLLVVDNCFCTPVLQQPLSFGADLIIHSTTKYIDGQGRSVGGAVVGPETILAEIYKVLRTCGPTMSPFSAWLALKGLETLPLRIKAQEQNAHQLAQWLTTQPQIIEVHYPGLTNHPYHKLASEQQSGYGAIVSFELTGGRKAAWKFIDSLKLLSITANFGDVKSTITHPASTTHARLTPEERDQAGINEGLLRISVGLENSKDLLKDCSNAFTTL